MSKTSTIVLVLSAAALLGGIGLLLATRKPDPLPASAVAYAQAALPAIATGWSVEALAARADAELLPELQQPGATASFAQFRTGLGALQSAATPECQLTRGFYSGKMETVARCDSKAQFAQGPATVSLMLHRVGEEWKIVKLNVIRP